MSSWQVGQRLDNEGYVIEKILGQGGFGITYLAKDSRKNRVVIKTLNQQVQNHPDFSKFRDDFYNEAVSLAKCKHTNIVSVIKIIHEQGLPCIVMEYIAGETLAQKVQNNENNFSELLAIKYIQEIGEALNVVHENNLLHRDVKPHNIIIRDQTNTAVLIDFGIARNFTPNERGHLTSFRSEGFAPIEQYDTSGYHGYHSDVYALAATLYFIVTKTKPVDALLRNAIRTETQRDSLRPPKDINPYISDRVNNAILVGMKLRPKDRPASIREWLSLLPEIYINEQPLIDKIKISTEFEENKPLPKTENELITNHTEDVSGKENLAIAPTLPENISVVKTEKNPDSPHHNYPPISPTINENKINYHIPIDTNKTELDTAKNSPSNNSLDWEIFLRVAFMAAGIWLLLTTLFKFQSGWELKNLLSLVTCCAFIFISQFRLDPKESKIRLFLVALISNIFVLLVIFLKIIPGSNLQSGGNEILTFFVAVMAFTLMAILKIFTESDYE
jgi:serine/threonine protein kinase